VIAVHLSVYIVHDKAQGASEEGAEYPDLAIAGSELRMRVVAIVDTVLGDYNLDKAPSTC
jgi:hypothetical protein